MKKRVEHLTSNQKKTIIQCAEWVRQGKKLQGDFGLGKGVKIWMHVELDHVAKFPNQSYRKYVCHL